MQLLDYSIPAILAVTIYALVDKVVSPLLKSRTSTAQDPHEFRIRQLEKDVRELRATLQENRTAIAVAEEILNRIDERL